MGFVVLIVFAVYVLFSISLMIGAHYLGKHKHWRWCNWWVAGLIMLLIPTWDILPGRLYFHHLCSTEAGMFVYKTVELPDEYFLKKGERDERYPERSENAYAQGGELNYLKARQSYSLDTNNYEEYSFFGHVKKRETILSAANKHTELARAVSFTYEGGWLIYSIFKDWPGSRAQCADLREVRKWHYALPESVFHKK